jgi:plastocyanin
MSTRTLSIICRSLFIVLTPVLFLASEARADDVFVGPTMQFSPSTVAIEVGETVNWKWNNTGYTNTYHSVHSGTPAQPNNLFDSGIHGGTYTFAHTFTTAGTFPYFCQVHTTMMTGTVLVTGPSPSPTPGGSPSTLGNISTRLRVQAGDNALIGGLIATGTVGKKVIIRAIGPSLSGFGVSGALANPTLDLFQGSTLLSSSDDWNSSTQQAEITSSGLAPSHAAESAIIWTLLPGQNYTAVVRGANGTTGIGVVDAFDLDPAAASKLGNISTRGFVDVDDNVMIAGLIAGPSNGTSLKILVRALGPTLSDFGVAGALANPTLDLVNSNGTVIRSNNNWKDDSQQRAQIEAAGLAPAHDEEAAVVETVAPGAYTAVVRGSGQTTGVGLVEAYNIP